MNLLNRIKIRLFWIFLVSFALILLNSRYFLSYVLSCPGSFNFQSLIQISSYFIDIGFVAILFLGFYHFGSMFINFLVIPAQADRFLIKTTEAALSRRSSVGIQSFEYILYSTVIGEALTSYVLLAFGLAGAFHPWFFRILFCILAYGAMRNVSLVSLWIKICWQALNIELSLITFASFCLISAALLRGAITSAAPPTDWDSLAYHLSFPKIFLKQGRIFRLPWAINSHYPLNTEMIYSLALSLRNDLCAHWINYIHGLLLLVSIICIALRYFSKHVAMGAVLILVSQPVFQRVIGNASTDFPVALASTLAFLSFLSYSLPPCGGGLGWGGRRGIYPFFLLSGILCGIAMSCKLTGVWTFATILLLIILSNVRLPDISLLFYFLLGSIVFGSPWYLKNIILTGNPVWPYCAKLFHGNLTDIESWQRIKASVTEGPGGGFLNYLLVPWNLAFDSSRFLYQPYYLWLPFLTLLIYGVVIPAKAGIQPFITKAMLLFLLIFTLIWSAVYGNWRYYLPSVGVISILISHWTLEIWNRKGASRWLACFSLLTLIPLKDLTVNNEAFVFLGLRSVSNPSLSPSANYLRRTLGDYYRVCEQANKVLPEDAKVLFYRDVRGYYLDREYAWGDPLNPGVFSYSRIANPESLRATLTCLGFTHVYYNPFIGGYQGDQAYYHRSFNLMEEFLRRCCTPLITMDGQALYKIN